MSYDIYLKDAVSGKTLMLNTPHHMTGGTYQVGGTQDAWLNVTYNYGKFYYEIFEGDKGIRTIYGMSAVDSIPILEAAIAKLGDDVSDNYWDATEGNAKSALVKLIALAKMRPDGIWDGD